MHDEFMYTSRPPLRKVFSENLYQELSAKYPDDPTLRIGVKLKWQYALLILLALAVLTFTFSEAARARALEWIKSIAGFTVEETVESPLKAVAEGEVIPTVYAVPTLALPDALENPPFAFGLPTWVPEGYVLDQNVGIANSKSWVSLTWRNADNAEIRMLVEEEYTGYNIPVGEGSSEEISINGEPALLVRGAWGVDHQWDPTRGIVIGWEKGGRFYRLSHYFEHKPANDKPTQAEMQAMIDILVRMAESIP